MNQGVSDSAPCPVFVACERNNAAVVAALLNHGVAVNTHCIHGCTALQEAVAQNNIEICEMLLKAGAKHNLPNMFGISPLFTAAQSGHLAVLRFLLRCGKHCHLLFYNRFQLFKLEQSEVGPLSPQTHNGLRTTCFLQVQTSTLRQLMEPRLCTRHLKTDMRKLWSSFFFRMLMPTNLERRDCYHCTLLPRREVTCKHIDYNL